MSLPADIDVRSLTYGEYRLLRVHAAVEALYADSPRRRQLPSDRISCAEAVRRYEAWRMGRLP